MPEAYYACYNNCFHLSAAIAVWTIPKLSQIYWFLSHPIVFTQWNLHLAHSKIIFEQLKSDSSELELKLPGIFGLLKRTEKNKEIWGIMRIFCRSSFCTCLLWHGNNFLLEMEFYWFLCLCLCKILGATGNFGPLLTLLRFFGQN